MSVIRWFDSEAGIRELQGQEKTGIDWPRILPFIILHVMCLGVFWVGWSWIAVATAMLLYVMRMFAITGFYHRYFSHKAFRTNRFWQFVFAVSGNSSAQRGPLWWAAHHRHHHRSTTALFHGTATINSLDHLFGSRRYDTPDTSRNNLLLALITLGEGWHNNHHHYAVSARQGFFWWEIDITYYLLCVLAGLGMIWDLHPLPDHIKYAA